MDVALARCLDLPEPDADEDLLVDALRARGIDANAASWDDPAFDWSHPALTVVRATWNYYRDLDGFLGWCGIGATDARPGPRRLLNPPGVIAWNAHKRYLVELATAGVATTPTVLVAQGDAAPLATLADMQGWHDVVVKPAVSAGSHDTIRACLDEPDDAARADRHLRALALRGDVLVQQYLPSVEGHGERALMWVDGELTHAVRKSPRFAGEEESVSGALPIADDEAALARAVLGVARTRFDAADDLLYARIDIARDADGDPCLMELELIEPSLFLDRMPAALDRFADAIVSRLGSSAP